jgi:hypothetical protein
MDTGKYLNSPKTTKYHGYKVLIGYYFYISFYLFMSVMTNVIVNINNVGYNVLSV